MKLVVATFGLIISIGLSSQENLKLIYDEPAREWMEALPIGNGFLGAMVYGGVENELLKLNHDEFWSGEPKDFTTPGAAVYKDSVANLVRNRKYTDADQLIRNMQGPFSQAYMPLANLHIKFNHHHPKNYRRSLNISEAISEVAYESEGVRYQRSYFSSFPDSVLVCHFTSSAPALLSFEISLSSEVKYKYIDDDDKIILRLKAPRHAEPNYRQQYTDEEAIQYDNWNGKGIDAYLYLVVDLIGGSYKLSDHKMTVSNADEATLKIIASTSFNGPFLSPSKEGKDALALNDHILKETNKRTYDEMLAIHRRDYKSLFDRVSLVLGSDSAAIVSTDQRLHNFNKDNDPSLVALLFQYGRYLLISSSRPGSQAANLQGIWSKSTRPPWSSNYTQNINVEMNYWPADVCNLGECLEPFVSLARSNTVTGKSVARVNYGLQGWVSHHNGDLWAHSAPVGDYGEGNPVWANWAMGGAWMCQHIWDHYLFTGDDVFLEENYHVLKGAALFVNGLLDENEDRKLETMFGTSPENQFFDPETRAQVSVARGVAMDLALANELLNNTLKAAVTLGVDEDFQDMLTYKIKRLQPFRISETGILMEWNEDFEEVDPQHRHLSHLYGVHPGNQINPWDNPELFVAARNSLLRRGDAATGWSMGWKSNLWARMLDGNHAYKIIQNLFTPIEESEVRMGGGGLYKNLLDAHPPFQIDGNFGVTAGIAEMLVQSHTGFIHILPALPDAWPEGTVKGLKTRGNTEIDISWKGGKPTEITLRANLDGTVKIRSEWPLDLINYKNSDENPLLDKTEIPKPSITGSPNLNIDLKKYYYYSIPMEAGEIRNILPL